MNKQSRVYNIPQSNERVTRTNPCLQPRLPLLLRLLLRLEAFLFLLKTESSTCHSFIRSNGQRRLPVVYTSIFYGQSSVLRDGTDELRRKAAYFFGVRGRPQPCTGYSIMIKQPCTGYSIMIKQSRMGRSIGRFPPPVVATKTRATPSADRGSASASQSCPPLALLQSESSINARFFGQLTTRLD